jgi:hypothetical protein
MAGGLLLALAVSGCAAMTCKPATIIVARKEERGRLELRSSGLYRTTGTGRLEPVQTPELVREHWVQSEGGEWYRVTAEQFTAAEVKRPIEVCQ